MIITICPSKTALFGRFWEQKAASCAPVRCVQRFIHFFPPEFPSWNGQAWVA